MTDGPATTRSNDDPTVLPLVALVGQELGLSELARTADALVKAIVTEDAVALTRVKGVGKKTAEQMLLDLREKITRFGSGAHADLPSTGATPPPSSLHDDAISALASIGYKEKEADKLASDLLIPSDLWRESRLRRFPTSDRVRQVAMRAHVSPAVVAGRVRRETGNYKVLSALVGSRKLRKQFPRYKAGVAA